jgi:hypothetical protein
MHKEEEGLDWATINPFDIAFMMLFLWAVYVFMRMIFKCSKHLAQIGLSLSAALFQLSIFGLLLAFLLPYTDVTVKLPLLGPLFRIYLNQTVTLAEDIWNFAVETNLTQMIPTR